MDKDFSFKSERLRFRGIKESDAETIVAWRSNPANYRFFFNAKPITLEEHLVWFGRYLDDPTRYDFMMMGEGGESIGTVGLSSIASGSCEISYMIGDVKARGKGYAKEAVRRLTEIAFDELGVEEVVARVVPGNDASAAVLAGSDFAEVERVFRAKKGSVLKKLRAE